MTVITVLLGRASKLKRIHAHQRPAARDIWMLHQAEGPRGLDYEAPDELELSLQ